MTNALRLKALEKCTDLLMKENVILNKRVGFLESIIFKQQIPLWEKIKWIFKRK